METAALFCQYALGHIVESKEEFNLSEHTEKSLNSYTFIIQSLAASREYADLNSSTPESGVRSTLSFLRHLA
jgi:hypothetical protein